MPDCVLGIDGGQTATTAAICDLSGRLLGVGRAGPANHVWEPGGVARARNAVKQCLSAAAREAWLRSAFGGFRAAFLGMTGGDDRTRRAIAKIVHADRYRMENDKVNALACVTGGKPGLVVIAGTGTITYGENARGRSATVSGWGFLLGDEGAATRAYDGRGEATALLQKLTAAAGVADLWDLHALIYSEHMSRAETAALATVVPTAAAEGDRVAQRLLRAAGRELGLAAGTVARQLRMHRGAVTVGMVGGVFRGSEQVRRAFRREVRRHAPHAIFAEPRYSPVIGSVLLALRMSEVEITPAVSANLLEASSLIGQK
jgi:N-acetylglucosamine kinase-like BadF-type ATPase